MANILNHQKQKQLRLLFRSLLYPADVTNEGKELRIKQQYFFISASLQQLVKTITVNLVH